MSPARAFLADILDKPDDEAVRLIFADWLEDHGDPRGPFIRLQCRLAHLAGEDPRRCDLEGEIQDLLLRQGEEWTAPLHGLAVCWDFRRGFIETLSIYGSRLLDARDRLLEVFANNPIRDLTVWLTGDMPRQAGVLAQFPGLARVEHLGVIPYTRGLALREPEAEMLLGSPYLGRLRHLDLPHNELGSGFIRWLVEMPLLEQLTSLDLGFCSSLGGQAARLLAGASRAHNLRSLCLDHTNIGTPGLQALLATKALPALHTLKVSGVHSTLTSAQAAFMAQLAPDCLLDRLQDLDLSDNEIHPELARALFASPLLARLTRLGLSRTGQQPHEAERLAQSPHLANLTSLVLGGNRIGPLGATALAQSPHLAQLIGLDLAGNGIRDSGVKALASSPYLTRLTDLDLGKNGIGGPGWQALLSSPNFAYIRHLGMRENYVGVKAMEALAASPHLRHLTHLDLRDNHLESSCARILAGARNMASLHALLLQNNRLGDDGAAILAGAPNLGRLGMLGLDSNEICKAGADALADAPGLGRLQMLELRKATISDTERQRLRTRYGDRVSL